MIGDLLWRKAEDDTIALILSKLYFGDLETIKKKSSNEITQPPCTSDIKEKNLLSVVKLIKFRIKHNYNRKWTLGLLRSEIINCINIFIQIHLTNRFLGDNFYKLGLIDYNDLEKIFPLSSKCIFYRYGPSGTIEKYDALCYLTMNKANIVIFHFLWYAYIIVAILSFLNIIWRLLQYTLYRFDWFTRYIFGESAHSHDTGWFTKLTYYDWLFLKYFESNLSPIHFNCIIVHVIHSDKLIIHKKSLEDIDDTAESSIN
ncbi:hypothetical protein O3M35_009084 [Rhynocoris fuscipes]|uniref:Innexin n=1 Tax=Rhynocoris fuscipes TaxID=488301 RepID=A0AAW1D315_9HEMI